MRSGRELKHRSALAGAKARQQYQLPIREFERVVMVMGIVQVDLTEARQLLV
jgi:hypothetical protein